MLLLYSMKSIYKQDCFYLEFPILQITYIIFWIQLGCILSFLTAYLFIKILSSFMVSVLYLIFPLAIDLFILSGRLQVLEAVYLFIIGIIFDIILLILGLGYIKIKLDNAKIEKENGK